MARRPRYADFCDQYCREMPAHIKAQMEEAGRLPGQAETPKAPPYEPPPEILELFESDDEDGKDGKI